MATELTPWASLFGGLLIGLAAVILMGFRGRIFGVTGILAGFIKPASPSDWLWRALLLSGMATAPALYLTMTGDWPTVEVPVSTAMLVGGAFWSVSARRSALAGRRATGSAAWRGSQSARLPPR